MLTAGVMYPIWVSEGVATNFETEVAERAASIKFRPALVAARARPCESKAFVPLDKFLTMTHSDPMKATISGCLCAGLSAIPLSDDAPAGQARIAYLADLAALDPGARAIPSELLAEFVRSFGPIQALEAQWRASLHETVAHKQKGPANRIGRGACIVSRLGQLALIDRPLSACPSQIANLMRRSAIVNRRRLMLIGPCSSIPGAAGLHESKRIPLRALIVGHGRFDASVPFGKLAAAVEPSVGLAGELGQRLRIGRFSVA